MQLNHSFTVPVPTEAAWDALVDFERVAPCLPGAKLHSVEGDVLNGAVKVKLGPVMLNYEGTATILNRDPRERLMVMDGRAKDSKGNGTAAAKITARLEEDTADSTRVLVQTDLDITGRPAQFGRGMMQDVGNKIIGQFADRLAVQLIAPEATAPELSSAPSRAAEGATSRQSITGDQDVLDLGSMVGPDAMKRAGATLAVLALLLLLWRQLR